MSAIQLLESLSKDPMFKNNMINNNIETLLSKESLQGIEDLKDNNRTMRCFIINAKNDEDNPDKEDIYLN